MTIRAENASAIALQLTDLGLSVQPIGLKGRYHDRSTHQGVLQCVQQFCEQDKRLQLPTAEGLNIPLRSNIDGEIITSGALHEIALESLLLYQSKWFQTAKAAVTSTEPDSVLPVGSESVLPRSLVSLLATRRNTQAPNGDATPIQHGLQGSDKRNIPDDSSIAVVGMACRYPEAPSLEDFWNLISSATCTVGPLPEDRFKSSDIRREPKRQFWGSFFRNPDLFDNRFFGISGREAKSMDPQQRLLLQVAYEALESSGYFGLTPSPGTSRPEDVGCYVGVGSVDYGDNVGCHDATAFSALGTLRAFISGRVSHHFGWSGPSITYDTACSSAAVAIHSAVTVSDSQWTLQNTRQLEMLTMIDSKALKSGECSMALAGGVNNITSPGLFQNLAAASFLSPTGPSNAFDASANGYCRGEGAGVVVLKPLERALADGDSILACITGSAVNQGSNCSPITVPVSDSQTSLYRRALQIAKTDPAEVTYVEAHGTGRLFAAYATGD